MRILRGIARAAGVVVVAACGGGGDATEPPASADLVCVNPTTAGAAVTCSVTLPEEAGLKAVLSQRDCKAIGDAVVIATTMENILTEDGCSETVGKEITLGAYPSGTEVTLAFTPGAEAGGEVGLGAARRDGAYPEWTLHLEDAVGAYQNEADDYNDLTITVTVVPAGE